MLKFCRAILVASIFFGIVSSAPEEVSSQVYGQPTIGILTFPVTEELVRASLDGKEGARGRSGGNSLPHKSLSSYLSVAPDGHSTPTFPPSSDASSSSSLPSYFDASYVQWLEQAGARIVPIPFDISTEDLEVLFDKLNGVLFTGGPAQPETDKQYFETATNLFNLVSSSSSHVPLWGTCLGFETISSIVGSGEDNVLSEFDAEQLSLPLTFTPEAETSQVYSPSNMPSSVRDILSTQNVTTHWHMYGVSAAAFASNLAPSGLVSTSINFDKEGKEFVSSLEHSSLPIFATQWHPEANQYDTTDKKGDATPNRSPNAVSVMQHMSNFFVGEARKNANSFASEDDFSAHVLDLANYNTYFDGWIYYFNEVSKGKGLQGQVNCERLGPGSATLCGELPYCEWDDSVYPSKCRHN